MNDYVKQKKYFVDTFLKTGCWSHQYENLNFLLQAEAASSQKEVSAFVGRVQSRFSNWIVWECFCVGFMYYALISNESHWKIVYGNEFAILLEDGIKVDATITFITVQLTANDFHIIIGDSKGNVSYFMYSIVYENLNKVRSLFYKSDSLLPSSVSSFGKNNVKFVSSIISKECSSLVYFWVVYESYIVLLAVISNENDKDNNQLKVVIQYNVPFNAKLINCEVRKMKVSSSLASILYFLLLVHLGKRYASPSEWFSCFTFHNK
jgi:hypothetical protein